MLHSISLSVKHNSCLALRLLNSLAQISQHNYVSSYKNRTSWGCHLLQNTEMEPDCWQSLSATGRCLESRLVYKGNRCNAKDSPVLSQVAVSSQVPFPSVAAVVAAAVAAASTPCHVAAAAILAPSPLALSSLAPRGPRTRHKQRQTNLDWLIPWTPTTKFTIM